jgi:hypothetical protein
MHAPSKKIPPQGQHSTNDAQGHLLDLFETLAQASGDQRWTDESQHPTERAKIVAALDEIAELPIAGYEDAATVSFVVGKHVINIRPVIYPTVVLMLMHAAVAVAPGLESPLLLAGDIAAYAEKLGKLYRKLSPDQVDVFGAVSDLYRMSKWPSVTNPNAHPTLHGVEAWFQTKKIEPPTAKIEEVLRSLVDAGALESEGDGVDAVYKPTFLGKKE